jgi:hypothetical protein
MIVANCTVVPRSPRSSYNLLSLRYATAGAQRKPNVARRVGDLVYRVLSTSLWAWCLRGVLWRTPNRCGERSASRACVCRLSFGSGPSEGCTTGKLCGGAEAASARCPSPAHDRPERPSRRASGRSAGGRQLSGVTLFGAGVNVQAIKAVSQVIASRRCECSRMTLLVGAGPASR